MDVADRAFQYADKAAGGAQRAASRASPGNEERLEKVRHAAHAHWLVAERHYGGAREAHADGQKSRLEYHATEVISAAVETQRAAGVATTADALKEVLEGLKPATERAQQTEARAQLRAELDKQKAEQDRELTAVTGMDAANRDRLQQVRWRAESAVPELGWWPTLAADMAHAYQGRLWLDETGTPRLLKTTADGGVVAGQKVNAERVAMLRAAGFLQTGTDSGTSTPLHSSDMGREALYLATLYPEGLHADERAAYDARYARARRPWMNNEERKSAARRLPPLSPHAMRAVREKPVLLEDDQIPQISTEKAARHADMAELAQRLWRWMAMSQGERSDVIQAPGMATAQKPEEVAGELGQDIGGDERAAAVPRSERPRTLGQNAPLADTTPSTTTPDEASEDTNGPPADDVTPTQSRTHEFDDDPGEPEGWPASTSSAPAEASAMAPWDEDGALTALLESPEPQDDPATDTLPPSVREQTALFSVPAPPPTTAQDSTATEATAAEPEEELPRFSQARKQILDEIARGNISELHGQFMQRVPRRSVRPVGSPQRINAVLDEELAERNGEQIQLSERGLAWYAYHKCPLPAVPRDIATVEQAPLPPIDYAPLHALPTLKESSEAPQPPAPAPLPDNWYKRGTRLNEESIQKAYAMGAEAAERAARSTARDVASMAAGDDHSYWTHQHPLAQYDENAAAALESVTDPVTRTYAARAVRNLRGALEEAGKEATDHYVQNVRSPQWKTAEGSQSDDVHRDRVRGIVLTYCLAVRDHATAYGLDTHSIVNVLEDAAGWTGSFRPLGLKKVGYPHLPAAENVAEAAQHVANALRLYALGRTDTVDTAADRRNTWRTVEPRPVPAPPTTAEWQSAAAEGQAPRVPAASEGRQGGAPAPAQVQDEAPHNRPAAGPQVPDAVGAAAEASPSPNGAAGDEAATPAPPVADDTSRTQQAARQGPDHNQSAAEQARPGRVFPVRQITQQSDGAEDPAGPAPQTAQEATTMAVDLDDDIQMPVLELSGEVPHLTTEEAAPRLLAHAQTHLADGRPTVEQFAHIYGCPVYAMVVQGETPTLYLGLTPPDTEGDTRAVSIRGDELATVTAETLLTAVTGWLNGSDAGERPLLDYASGTAATPTPVPAEQEAPVPTHSRAPAVATAGPTMANDTVAKPSTPQAPAPDGPAEAPEAEATSASTPPAPELAPTPPSEQARHTTSPARTAATSTPAASTLHTAADGQVGAEDTSQETVAAPAADPNAVAQADPVAQITALVRTSLSDGGVTLGATGALTAPGTVTITLETSGTSERDRELADTLRTALNNALQQHPEPQLASYRVDFEYTSQPGQGSLSESAGITVIPASRDRLIAVNNAAAKIFAERLRSDSNAELARTYLSQERKLPAEVQQEWGLGYAPSDRGAKPKRWDVMVRALREQGYTEDELLQAGLATRSKFGALIDAFDDRIMFPIHDEHGDIVGFSGRRIDRPGETEEQAKERQSQKYYNTSNDAALFSKGELLFGLYHPAQAEALAGSSGPRVSVEGYLDVIAVARAAATLPLDRRPVVGAPMGADISERQLAELRGLDSDDPRPHIMFLDADDSGHKVLLRKSNELLRAPAPTEVTTAPGAKDAAKLWEQDIEAGGDGAAPVLTALEQRRPLLDAIVEAALLKHADEGERVHHAFDSAPYFQRPRFIAAEAARYIHQAVQIQAPGDRTALRQAALTWAKRLNQEWKIPGFMTATAVLLGPGKHHEDYVNEVEEQALDLLAADPEGYFANDAHVRSRQSVFAAPSATVSDEEASATRRPGQWPAGIRKSGRVTSISPLASEPGSESGELALNMFLPSPVDGQPVDYTDRTTAAYALHTAVHERFGRHTTESPEPDRLPQPLKLGTVYGLDLSTSGDDQTSEDPTVVVWLGSARSDSLRMSYSRFVKMTGPELLAAIEWRAAQAAGLLGAPLSPKWRKAVRSILPPQFPAQPTPAQLADLLDTIAQGPDGTKSRTRRRAEQAVAAYTAGQPDLALSVLAADDHIWVMRNDGSWILEDAVDAELSWEELETAFDQEAAELKDIAQAGLELPLADEMPMAADLTVAHHSAHEALSVLRPYSIGLPGTLYEKITDLVALMDAGEPAMRRLHGPGGEQLMNRAKTSFVRILEGLATVASKIRLTALSDRLERTVARLRGQPLDTLPTPRAVRGDRRMQDLAHIERDLERRMASPTTTLAERGELQEQWIVNRARWRARYEQLHGQPPRTDFLPDNGLIAGAPPIPNLIAAHDLLLDRLAARVAALRGTDPHTGEDANPYEPRADLLNGVAWAYQQRLIGFVPTGDDPQGAIAPQQLRQAALTVTSHQNASPLTLKRTMNVTAERADRLLHRLEQQQILGPYRADAPRTVLARVADIDILLAQPAPPSGPRTPPAADPAHITKSPAPEADRAKADADKLDTTRIRELVSKILADKQTRSATGGEPDPTDSAAPASRMRKTTAHEEAEDNALTVGQSTSLAQSQS